MKRRCSRAITVWLAGLGLVLMMLGGCAYGLVKHSFSFNAYEEPGIEILDYRYGDSRQPGARATSKSAIWGGKVRQAASISADMLRPDSLYVRWRVLSTDEIYEDTVDLARLLPRDISNHMVHFTVKDRQLFVYLITPERRSPTDPPVGPRPYQDLKGIVLSSNFGRLVQKG